MSPGKRHVASLISASLRTFIETFQHLTETGTQPFRNKIIVEWMQPSYWNNCIWLGGGRRCSGGWVRKNWSSVENELSSHCLEASCSIWPSFIQPTFTKKILRRAFFWNILLFWAAHLCSSDRRWWLTCLDCCYTLLHTPGRWILLLKNTFACMSN